MRANLAVTLFSALALVLSMSTWLVAQERYPSGERYPEAPIGGAITAGGVATTDIDLNSGGYQLLIDSGNVGAPAVAFGDAPTSGWYLDGDKPAIARGGVRMISFGGGPAVTVTNGYFRVSSYGLVPSAVTADPCGTASAYPKSSIFWNDTSSYWCGCDGTNDVKLSDGSACF